MHSQADIAPAYDAVKYRSGRPKLASEKIRHPFYFTVIFFKIEILSRALVYQYYLLMMIR